MAASYAMPQQFPGTGAKKSSFAPDIAVSLAMHRAFVGIPVLTMLLYHPTVYKRPATFQLVSAQLPRPAAVAPAPQQQTAKPAPQQREVTPVPKTSTTKPAPRHEKQKPKPVQQQPQTSAPTENSDELNELLSAIPVKSVSEIAISQKFKFNWYLQHITSEVEGRWKPPMGLTDKKDVMVVVAFTIFQNGTISRVQITQSSGITALDNCAVQSINASAPFPPLPIGFSEKKLDVNYTLYYVKS